MAIYSLHLQTISRGKGQSAIAAAAYRSGQCLTDNITGQIHDYTKKRGVIQTFIACRSTDSYNVHYPRADFAAKLWNTAEARDRRSNSVLAREFVLALPCEITAEAREKITRQFAEMLVQKHHVAVMGAIHSPDRRNDDRNHHAHVMISTRHVEFDYETRQFTFGQKTRELDDRSIGANHILEIRQEWEQLVNGALAAHGAAPVDCRSLETRGINRVARVHLGPAAAALERRGIATRKGDHNRAVDAVEAAELELAELLSRPIDGRPPAEEPIKKAPGAATTEPTNAPPPLRPEEVTRAPDTANALAKASPRPQAPPAKPMETLDKPATSSSPPKPVDPPKALDNSNELATASPAPAKPTKTPAAPYEPNEPPQPPTPPAASKSPANLDGLPMNGLFLLPTYQPMIRFYLYVRMHRRRPEVADQLLNPDSRLRKLFSAVATRLAPVLAEIDAFLTRGKPSHRQQAADALLARPPALDLVEQNLRDAGPLPTRQWQSKRSGKRLGD